MSERGPRRGHARLCGAEAGILFGTRAADGGSVEREAAKLSPRTLTVTISKDGKVTLTRGAELIAEGTTAKPQPIADRLALEFKNRRETNDWKPGYENRPEMSADDRIEKTVFIRAPQSLKYGEVVRVIDAIKDAGANPVGMQTELLEP